MPDEGLCLQNIHLPQLRIRRDTSGTCTLKIRCRCSRGEDCSDGVRATDPGDWMVGLGRPANNRNFVGC